jgi:pimeloyl-ACP methyl ester carboxylesterase
MAARGSILFAHANGFGAGLYQPLFDLWQAAGFQVLGPQRFGHDPRYPVTDRWPRLRDQLIDFADAHADRPAPTYLVGHSLGGVLSLMAASKRPDLAAGVVVLDSPVMNGWRAHSLHMLKASGLIKRVSPSRNALRRRHDWPTREAVRAHFAAKAVFARWDARMLDAYVASGFDDVAGRVALGFRREIEARIYDTLPHDLGARLRRHPLRCPAACIAGTQSAEMRQAGLDGIRGLVGSRLHWIEGTHLYPMEKPEQTAALVLQCIAEFAAERPRATAPATPSPI